MKKLVFLSVLLVAAGTLFASPADNFKAGSWEFGGNAMYYFIPRYEPFSSKTTSEDREGYAQMLDVELNIGTFPVDKLSLCLSPSIFWSQSHTDNDNYRNALSLDLDVGCLYYIPLGNSFVLSAGGKLGVAVLPGLDGKSSGSTETNKSLSMIFALEPDLIFYYFVSGNFAPFAQFGYRMMYVRDIKESDGSSATYPSDDEFFDHVRANLHFTLGLKFFLPAGGGRFGDAPGRTYADLVEKGGIGS